MIANDDAHGVIRVRAGASFVRGEVRRVGDGYVTLVDGSPLGAPTGLDFAIYRVSINIRLQLPVIAPEDWEVTIECERAGTFKVVFGDSLFRFDPDDVWREEISDLLQHLPRHTLSDAIESAAMLVKQCVRIPSGDRTIELPTLENIDPF